MTSRRRIPHQSLTTISELVESDETIGRIVGSGMLQTANKVWIERSLLNWAGGGGKAVPPPIDALDRFVLLWSADDQAILRFARDCGPPRRPLWVLRTENRREGYEGSESIDSIRALSRRAHDILMVASTLRSPDACKLRFEQWDKLSGGRMSELKIKKQYLRRTFFRLDDAERKDSEIAKLYLQKEVALWNATFGPATMSIRPEHEKRSDSDSGFKTILDFGGSVLSYLGLQLMLVMAGGDVFTCSACGCPYIRGRGRKAREGMRKAPKPGERNYCQKLECIRVRNRIASSRYRATHDREEE